MRVLFPALLCSFSFAAAAQKTPRAHGGLAEKTPEPQAPSSRTSVTPQPAAPPGPPAVSPHRFGRFDLDTPFPVLRGGPELRGCAEQLAGAAGHAECVLPKDADRIERVQLAWDDAPRGPELTALRLVFDPQLAPALTDLEWQLTRGWGPPALEQLRRERDVKVFTLQWEDAEHRATLEAQGPLSQPSRAVAIVLEKKPAPLPPDLAALHPRPFAGFRLRWLRRVEWEGVAHAALWGSNLTPAQEAAGETGPAWTTQRNYVGLWKLDPRSKRWKALWERTTGTEDDDTPQRVLRVEARDVTGDNSPDLIVALACETCGATADELIVKTVRAGKLVDLLAKRDLYRAQVQLATGSVRIKEPEGQDDQDATVTTYAYDRGRGAFVLAKEERVTSVKP